MNKVILTGRFTRDPESRMTQGNMEISRFHADKSRPSASTPIQQYYSSAQADCNFQVLPEI